MARQEIPMSCHESRQLGASDFLLAFEEELEVDGQSSCAFQHGLDDNEETPDVREHARDPLLGAVSPARLLREHDGAVH